jgi:hypothetical protein
MTLTIAIWATTVSSEQSRQLPFLKVLKVVTNAQLVTIAHKEHRFQFLANLVLT